MAFKGRPLRVSLFLLPKSELQYEREYRAQAGSEREDPQKACLSP